MSSSDVIKKPLRLAMGHLALALSAVVMLLSGCGTSAPTKWLSLPLPASAPASASGPVAGAAALPSDTQPVLVMRRINVPEYMQSASVRYREQASVLMEWPDVRWADRLEVGMTEHLLMRLRTHLPGWTVCERQCPVDSAAITLQVDVAPLDYVRSERALKAEARWTLTQRMRGDAAEKATTLGTNRSTQGLRSFNLAAVSDDASGQALAIGELLDLLARDLAREAVGWNGP
jgi:uncharacterized lipoprotein YmbA